MRLTNHIISILCSSIALLPAVLYAAEPCPSNVERTNPNSRFVVNGDGTVSDRVTGLIWKQCIEGIDWNASPTCSSGTSQFVNWENAFTGVRTHNGSLGGFAGANDWRIPNIKELTSIVEQACYDPAINLNVFPNTPIVNQGRFWSSTPDENRINPNDGTTRDYAWVVYFSSGILGAGTSGGYTKTGSAYVRLVRSPP